MDLIIEIRETENFDFTLAWMDVAGALRCSGIYLDEF
jgi:hypothetical protein